MEQKIDKEKEAALLRELPEALTGWYLAAEGTKTVLRSREDYESYLRSGQTYSIVVMTSFAEKERDIGKIIENVYAKLPADGKMLLALNNRLGIRYFCGDRDPYTERNFDSVEDYRRAYSKEQDRFDGRMYSYAQISEMLAEAGVHTFQFFSVFSDLSNPFLIYAQDYDPRENLAARAFPSYHYPDTVFLEEEFLYSGLIANGLFHRMSNAFLIECAKDGKLSDVQHVTASVERGHENGIYTLIHRTGMVEKRAIYPEGRERIRNLAGNTIALQARGIRVVEGSMRGDSYWMPYVEAPVGQVYLLNLLREDKEAFLKALDHFRDLILQSSEIKEDKEYGQVFNKAYVDMVPLNSFYKDGEFVFFDQEFVLSDYPVKVVLYRMICTLFAGGDAAGFIAQDELYERYGLKDELEKWAELERRFMIRLRNEDQLRIYHEKTRRNYAALNSNRQRLNFSEEEFRRRFVDIFHNLKGKRLIVFGSGRFAEHFIEWYGRDYPVAAIVDNNEQAWGKELNGIKVVSPQMLAAVDREEYRVVVCIKNYLSVMKQLKDMGIDDYVFYDRDKLYDTAPRIIRTKETADEAENGISTVPRNDASGKKYHVGYVAGTFDMFHMGHLNLLKKAKSMCDYLIVGVVSDEGVYRQKQKYPVIPCADRCEIIRACRYADQVEELPPKYDGIRDAYRRYRFDVQFSGDDHSDSVEWQATREFLKKNGADIIFFPYTQGVSSTMLREKLENVD